MSGYSTYVLSDRARVEEGYDVAEVQRFREDVAEAVDCIRSLDGLIHEPSRLAVMTVLRIRGEEAYGEFVRLTGLSKGNLSNHLAKLERAGHVEVGGHFEGKKPVTTVLLTEHGRERVEAYWDAMMRAAMKSGGPPPGRSKKATVRRRKGEDHG